MTEMVEVQRFDLTEEQALTVTTLTKAINDYQTRYGQHALGLDALRAQFEQNFKQKQQEGEAIRASLQEATQSLHEFSARLAAEFQLDLNDGVWTLNVEEGYFAQTKRPTDISAQRKTTRRSRKKTTKREPKKAALKKRAW